MNPNYPYTRWLMAKAYREQGKYQEAIATLSAELPKGRHPGVLAELAAAYVALGQRDEALKILAEVQQYAAQGYVGSMNFVRLYLGLGEPELALDWLEKAYAARHQSLIHLQVNPDYDRLRSHPRFQDLLRRIGLAQ